MTCQKCGISLRDDAKFCGNCGTPVGQQGPADPRIHSIEKALNFKYKILKKIGVGGFAEVFLGEHSQLGRQVAIKILRHGFAGEDEMIERFRRESKSAAKLSHPNIIDIYDVGENDEIYFFVMKYVEGETLGKKMQREKNIAPYDAVHIIKQVADALSYAHDHDVIHRDIKPANVMLDEYKKPILMDFGIARVQFEGNLTKTGTLMGTPHYLPPEQPLGRPVDGRSDIYSLGIMFYEMLAGRPPFHDENSVTLIFKHINEAPPQLLELNPELAPELGAVVHKMIEKLPENRYQSAAEVVEALDALAEVYPVPTPTTGGRGARSSGGTRNTDQLLQLARENLELQKFDKAIEIYATVVKRDPENQVAKQAVIDVSSILADRMRKQIDEHQFPEAKLLLTQLSKLPDSAEIASAMKQEIEKAEQNYAKHTEFQDHLDAAKVALNHDNASGAIDRLTKALIVDPASPEAQTMLKHARALYESNRQKAEFANAYSEAEYYFNKSSYEQALVAVRKALDIENDPKAVEMSDRIQAAQKEKAYKQSEQERILAEVDQLCESLDFDGAIEVLERAQEELPVFVESKIGVVQRNQELYQQFVAAKNSFQDRIWSDAAARFSEFLQKKPPYDFQVFYALRKEAEESLKLAEKESSIQGAGTEKRKKLQAEKSLKKVDVLLRMGQHAEAREECLQALKLFPNDEAVLKKLQEIEKMHAPAPKITTDEIEKVAKMSEGNPNETMQVPVPAGGRVPVIPPAPTAPPPPSPRVEKKSAPAPAAAPVQRPSSPSRPAPAPPPPRAYEAAEPKSFPLAMVLGAVGVLLVAAFLVIFLWPRGPNTNTTTGTSPTGNQGTTQPGGTTSTPPPEIPPVAVSINALPWATIRISGGDLKNTITEITPAIVSLPPGRYTVEFENPDLPRFTETLDVNESNRRFSFSFRQFDAGKSADSVFQ
ncbi:protein kinase [bacterium]|nr:protein kinase [bacterium]